MACIDEKGNLTATAKAILTAIETEAKTVEKIAEESLQAVFKIRSSLRDMKSMGFVKVNDEQQYIIDERAKKLLNKSS